MGKATWIIGSAPHQANLVKIAANFTLPGAREAA